MATHWITDLLEDAAATRDPLSIAHMLGGLVANDERLLTVIADAVNRCGDLDDAGLADGVRLALGRAFGDDGYANQNASH